jgi:hypothetical protein
MGKYNKALYPLLILVIGILVLYYVANTTEGFFSRGPLIASTGIPNAQVVPIYFLLKAQNAAGLTPVALSTPNSAIKKIERINQTNEFNNFRVTLDTAYTIHDFTAAGFKNNKKWEEGIVDEGTVMITLQNSNRNVMKRTNTKDALKKLPQKLSTFIITAVGPQGFGGIGTIGTTMNVNGDPARDGGKVSGPANIRIDLLLSK